MIKTQIVGAKMICEACSECVLKDRPYVPDKVPAVVKGIVVGEAPGYEEASAGEPFVGPSGQLLKQVLAYQGLDLSMIMFTNVVCCHPVNNKLRGNAVATCTPMLLERLAEYPDVPVLCLGNTAAEAVIGKPVSKTRMYWHGRCVSSWHPAYVLRTPIKIHEFVWDVMKFADKILERFLQLDITWDVPLLFEEAMDMLVPLFDGTHKTVCIDLETSDLRYWVGDILSVGIADTPEHAIVLPQRIFADKRIKERVNAIFADPTIKVVGHNVTFDARWLVHHGVPGACFDHDTQLAMHALNENTARDLKTLASVYCNAPDYEKELVKTHKKTKESYSVLPKWALHKYNAYDVCYNLALWFRLEEALFQEDLYKQPYMYPVMAAVPHLLRLELGGVDVSVDQIQRLADLFQEKIDEQHAVLVTRVGHEFNANSWKQVGKILYDEFGLPRISGRGFKRGSTNEYARQALHDRLPDTDPRAEWIDMYNELKKLMKLRSSYVVNVLPQVDQDGRVHPSYRLDGTVTGRMSAKDPAIQTIPRAGSGVVAGYAWGADVRGCYIAPPGHKLVGVDYSQAELRMVAVLSGDESMLGAYRAGRDLHSETAEFLFGPEFEKEDRQIAKNFNFASIYSFNENAFQVEKGMDVREAKLLVKRFHSLRAQLVSWQHEQVHKMNEEGYVSTLTGRQRRFPLIMEPNRDIAEKSSFNMPVQGMASELMLMSFIEASQMLHEDYTPEDARVVALIHDELLLLVRDDLALQVGYEVLRIMLRVAKRWVPEVPWGGDIEVGQDWGHMKEV